MTSKDMTVSTTSTALSGVGQGPSILGESNIQVPTIGRIRPGIKVLTKATAANPKAVEIYERGVTAGASFSAIEAQIKKALNLDEKKRPLVPKNVGYFRVVPGDFKNPASATSIMEKYGSDGPDGYQLYRFPVIFPFDSWLAVLPHEMATYTFGEKKFWSSYSADGERVCKTHGELVANDKNKRLRRAWGGRPVVTRKLCEPESCEEYQAGKCNLKGRLLFFVPDIAGSGMVDLPTNSYYSMEDIRRVLEMTLHITGRISGTFNGEPMFMVSKAQREVSRIDPDTGKAQRVTQWLIVLESNLDITAMYRGVEANRALEASGQQARAALEHDGSSQPAHDIPQDDDEDGEPLAGELVDDHDQENPSPPENENPSPEDEAREALEAARDDIRRLLPEAGLAFNMFSPYAIHTWGENWSRNIETLKKAADDISAGMEDPEGYKDRVINYDDIPF